MVCMHSWHRGGLSPQDELYVGTAHRVEDSMSLRTRNSRSSTHQPWSSLSRSLQLLFLA